MPGEDKNFGGSLVLDFRKWWRHVKTIYTILILAVVALIFSTTTEHFLSNRKL